MNKSFSESDRRRILAFVAAFLWADFAPDARRLGAAAKELGLRVEDAAVRRLLRAPPREEEVDPARLSPRAHAVTVALCKQAIRGRRSHAARHHGQGRHGDESLPSVHSQSPVGGAHGAT